MIVRNRSGVSILIPLFLLVVVGALALSAVMITQSDQRAAGDASLATINFYSANSGLEWVRQVTNGYRTADKAKWKSLNGLFKEFAGPGGPRFTLQVIYKDDDNNQSTADTVTIISTGSFGDSSKANSRRMVTMTLTVPVYSGSALFVDEFDQPDVLDMNQNFHFGQASAEHGGMTPYSTALATAGGDIYGLFTHSSEAAGSPGILRIGGSGEARLIISTGSCFKWSVSGVAGSCDYAQCVSKGGCRGRTGINIAKDGSGYQNYFVKIRARLISGDGFGIYFRSTYANQSDPYLVDLGTLTGYIWQYDRGMGYILPCAPSTAVSGNDSMGMFITRRVDLGSETCGANCAIYTSQADSATYPLFCPENKTGLPQLDGWLWTNWNWLNYWRTVYIYVYQSKANIYVGREEIAGLGGEGDPVRVGEVKLADIGTILKTGDIGIRVWNGGVAQIDYIKIYSNDSDNNPATFPGD